MVKAQVRARASKPGLAVGRVARGIEYFRGQIAQDLPDGRCLGLG